MNIYERSIVIDNGTGGNLEPDYIFPTAISDITKKTNISLSNKNDEYNYAIGYEGLDLARRSKDHSLTYPMSNGLIDNWDLMEKFWHQSIFHYMKCDPENHYFVLTEPPMNPPENRENMAEIFFETFNVPGLYIGVQAVFALVGCNETYLHSKKEGKLEEELFADQINAINSLTGLVIDSGDGVTHVVPICDGFVLASGIKHIPIAGRKITKFMMEMIRDRNEPISPEDLYFATMDIKEKYGYLCRDVVEEYGKFDLKVFDERTKDYIQPSKFKKFNGTGKISNKPFSIDVGYEAFLGPEAFFSPEIIDKDYRTSIDELVDLTIQQCPIDYRRKLYSNIILSGGSTLFKNFDKRLEKSLQARVNERLEKYSMNTSLKPKPIKTNVTKNLAQRHSVWLGGSCFASKPSFGRVVHTREEYLEKGPSCCRYNAVFGFN